MFGRVCGIRREDLALFGHKNCIFVCHFWTGPRVGSSYSVSAVSGGKFG
jgi:hypothetical protein